MGVNESLLVSFFTAALLLQINNNKKKPMTASSAISALARSGTNLLFSVSEPHPFCGYCFNNPT
jgi:hypothetical protein